MSELQKLAYQCEGLNFFIVVNYGQNISESTDEQLKFILKFKSVKTFLEEEYPEIYIKIIKLL